MDFPYTHNIATLLKLASKSKDFTKELEESTILTFYATAMRYPGDYSNLIKKDATQAVQLAEKVRNLLRSAFNEEGLEI